MTFYNTGDIFYTHPSTVIEFDRFTNAGTFVELITSAVPTGEVIGLDIGPSGDLFFFVYDDQRLYRINRNTKAVTLFADLIALGVSASAGYPVTAGFCLDSVGNFYFRVLDASVSPITISVAKLSAAGSVVWTKLLGGEGALDINTGGPPSVLASDDRTYLYLAFNTGDDRPTVKSYDVVSDTQNADFYVLGIPPGGVTTGDVYWQPPGRYRERAGSIFLSILETNGEPDGADPVYDTTCILGFDGAAETYYYVTYGTYNPTPPPDVEFEGGGTDCCFDPDGISIWGNPGNGGDFSGPLPDYLRRFRVSDGVLLASVSVWAGEQAFVVAPTVVASTMRQRPHAVLVA